MEDNSQATFHHTKNSVSCYSFAPTKHLTMGQGGAICTDDFDMYEKLTKVKDHGRSDRYISESAPKDIFTEWGTNFKVTEFQASFGLEQLKKLPKRYDRLHEIYNIYHDELASDKIEFLEQEPKWFIDIYVKNPDKLIAHLKKNSITSKRVHKPIHMQPEFGNKIIGKYTNSEEIYNRGMFLPSTTNLDDESILEVCRTIKQLF